MKIKIEDYTLYSDGICFWITKDYVSEKTGKPSEKRLTGYHSTLRDALNYMIDKYSIQNEMSVYGAINSVVEAQEVAKKMIEEALKC